MWGMNRGKTSKGEYVQKAEREVSKGVRLKVGKRAITGKAKYLGKGAHVRSKPLELLQTYAVRSSGDNYSKKDRGGGGAIPNTG